VGPLNHLGRRSKQRNRADEGRNLHAHHDITLSSHEAREHDDSTETDSCAEDASEDLSEG
jgi:hypothetical protein